MQTSKSLAAKLWIWWLLKIVGNWKSELIEERFLTGPPKTFAPNKYEQISAIKLATSMTDYRYLSNI